MDTISPSRHCRDLAVCARKSVGAERSKPKRQRRLRFLLLSSLVLLWLPEHAVVVLLDLRVEQGISIKGVVDHSLHEDALLIALKLDHWLKIETAGTSVDAWISSLAVRVEEIRLHTRQEDRGSKVSNAHCFEFACQNRLPLIHELIVRPWAEFCD